MLAVRRPTVPLAGASRAAIWKRTTERRVPEPKLPSIEVGMPTSVSQRWRMRTSPPLSPTRSTRLIDEADADDANDAETASSAISAPARCANARRQEWLDVPSVHLEGVRTTGT